MVPYLGLPCIFVVTQSFFMGDCKRTKHSFLFLTFPFQGWMLISFINLKPLLLIGKWEYSLMSYKLRWHRLEKLINRKHYLSRIQLEAICQIHCNSDQDTVSDQPQSTLTCKGNFSWRITVRTSKNVSSSYPSLFQESVLLFSAKLSSLL